MLIVVVIIFDDLHENSHASVSQASVSSRGRGHNHLSERTCLLHMQLEARATCEVVTRKPAVAGEEEIQNNPRSRSAKLRVLERKRA